MLRNSGKVGAKRSQKAALTAISLLLSFSRLTFAEETNSTSNSTPKPTSSTNHLAGFQIEPGFRIELIASEPMVTTPVAMAFDENGRLFVAELPAYSDRQAGKQGRVRVLDNINDHGVFQNSTIYADSLQWPSALACYAGGVFVATGPDILYLKDTKGDGVADARQVVLSGFGRTNALDPVFLPNNFNWGPDNRIHGVTAGTGGEISSKSGNGPVSIDGNDFSFDPRTLEAFAEAGPAQSGLSFDSNGHKFLSDFLRPVLMPNYDWRYFARNPYFPKPPALAPIADPKAPVYRMIPEATPGGSANQNTNLVAPMNMARGCVVYRGRSFPTNYFENVFVADPAAHLIHRFVLRENGLETLAQRAPDERNSEFLASRDEAFRPVQVINGPDGALYVADVREDTTHGRIYRILPANLKTAKPPQLGKVKTFDLVSVLAQGDGWHRDTAARLLYERKDSAAPALLRGTLNRSRLPQARMLALHALAGASALTEQDALKALRDLEPEVRRHGLLLLDPFFTNGSVSEEILAQLRILAEDSSPKVRYQLALTLGNLRPAERAPLLSQVLARDVNNYWMRMAALSSSGSGAGDLFVAVAANPRVTSDPAGVDFLQQLALMIGLSGQLDSVSETASLIASGRLNPALAYNLLYYLGEGLYRTRSSLSLIDSQGLLQPFFNAALNVAIDPNQPEAVRIATTRLVGVSPLGAGVLVNWSLILCSPPTSSALQSAAVQTLIRHEDPQIVQACMGIWPLLAPVARSQAITALLSRKSGVSLVLDALQNGQISAVDLSATHRNFLRTYPIAALRLRALQVLGPLPVSRPAIIATFKSALSLPGTIDRGREIFRQRCAECHQSATSGQEESLGPDLLGQRAFTRQQLLAKIIEPNVTVRPDYSTQVVESKDGESLVGIVSADNRWTFTLSQVGGSKLVWPQLNVSSTRPESWSLMPDGLERGLAPQDMADLMECVQKGK